MGKIKMVRSADMPRIFLSNNSARLKPKIISIKTTLKANLRVTHNDSLNA